MVVALAGLSGFAVAAAAAAPAAGAATLTVPTTPIATTTPGTVSNVAIGVETNFGWYSTTSWTAPDMAQLSANGVHEVRQDFRWDLTETQNGVYSWGRLDTIMTQAAINRVDVLPILDYTPGWANNNAGAYNPPTDLNLFAAFGATVVARYGRGGSFWAAHPTLTPEPLTAVEVWDEPWCSNTWVHPDAAAYAQMVRLTSTAVRGVDPLITVAISTDTFYANGQGPTLIKWVTALAQAFPDMAAYIGAASVHLYNNGLDPTSLEAGNVALVVSTLAADNVSVPVWVTETGSNATAISAAYFSAAPRTIVPLAWVVQGNFATSTLDNLNSLATTDNIQRVYSFSFSRSASQTAWTWADPIDSGWLLEGPTGQVRGAGTAVFSWVAAHQPVAAP